MTEGPYRTGPQKLSAHRLNETDRLARRRYRFGTGFKVTDTGHELRVDVKPDATGPRGSTGARFGYITATTETPMIVVQFLNYAIAPVGNVDQIAWTKEGEPRPAWLQPNAKPEDVAQLVRTSFGVTAPVVRLDRINGIWFATFQPRWSVIRLPNDVVTVRCNQPQ